MISLVFIFTSLSLSVADRCQLPLDVLFVQDATAGFADDFKYFREQHVPAQISALIRQAHPKSRLGLLSFRDKPLWPAGTQADYCSRLETDLTSDSSVFERAYESLSSGGGGDWAEGQFGALVDAIKAEGITWTRDSDATRLIILVTDAPVHFAGDGLADLHHLPAFTEYDSSVNLCTQRDYPSMEQIKKLAKENDIHIAIIVSDETAAQLPRRAWTWVAGQLDQEKMDVVGLAGNGANMTSAVEAVVRRIEEIRCRDGEGEEDCTMESLPASYEERMADSLKCLRANGVEFLERGTANFVAATTPQDAWFARRNSLAVIFPRNEETIQAAVECAFKSRVNIIARSGGHDYSSYSYGIDNDIILDLVNMDKLDLDSSSGIAKVGPGLRLSPLIYNAFLDGEWMVPAGACTAVGLGGHATGGGYGYYSRALGLLSDRIIGGKMVLGNGTLIQFNKEENADLLWALQGGTASNFGILTELTLQMLKAPPLATALTIAYPATSLKAVLQGMVVMLEKAPRELGFSTVWDNTKTAIQMNYFGSYPNATDVLQPFFEVAGNGVVLGTQGDFLRSFASLAIASITDTERPALPIPAYLIPALNTSSETYIAPRESYQAKSMLWGSGGPFDEACIDTIVSAVRAAPTNFGLAIELWGGDSAIAQRTVDATAFPHHNATFVSHIYAKNQLLITPTDTAFLEQYYNQVIKCASRSVYVNYKDFQLGEDTLDPLTWTTSGNANQANEMYLNSNLQRLKEIKEIYNPWNMFWYPQAI